MSVATIKKIAVIPRYGPFTRLASSVEYASSCSDVIAASCAAVYSMPDKMNALPMIGVTKAPTALNDCARFKRRSEDSGGPRIVTYGFAATSNTPCPHAITNSANKKNPYKRIDAAGINKNAPTAHVSSPARIPLLYPIRSSNQPAGNADKKYPPKNAD